MPDGTDMAIHETVEYRLHRVQQRLSVTDREQRSVHVSTLHITCVHDDKDNIFEHKTATKSLFQGFFSHPFPVAALHQGEPGQMTWLEDPPPRLLPAYCFALLLLLAQYFILNSRLGSSANPFLHRPFPFLPD